MGAFIKKYIFDIFYFVGLSPEDVTNIQNLLQATKAEIQKGDKLILSSNPSYCKALLHPNFLKIINYRYFDANLFYDYINSEESYINFFNHLNLQNLLYLTQISFDDFEKLSTITLKALRNENFYTNVKNDIVTLMQLNDILDEELCNIILTDNVNNVLPQIIKGLIEFKYNEWFKKTLCCQQIMQQIINGDIRASDLSFVKNKAIFDIISIRKDLTPEFIKHLNSLQNDEDLLLTLKSPLSSSNEQNENTITQGNIKSINAEMNSADNILISSVANKETKNDNLLSQYTNHKKSDGEKTDDDVEFVDKSSKPKSKLFYKVQKTYDYSCVSVPKFSQVSNLLTPNTFIKGSAFCTKIESLLSDFFIFITARSKYASNIYLDDLRSSIVESIKLAAQNCGDRKHYTITFPLLYKEYINEIEGIDVKLYSTTEDENNEVFSEESKLTLAKIIIEMAIDANNNASNPQALCFVDNIDKTIFQKAWDEIILTINIPKYDIIINKNFDKNNFLIIPYHCELDANKTSFFSSSEQLENMSLVLSYEKTNNKKPPSNKGNAFFDKEKVSRFYGKNVILYQYIRQNFADLCYDKRAANAEIFSAETKMYKPKNTSKNVAFENNTNFTPKPKPKYNFQL